jgi:hypothetical protein
MSNNPNKNILNFIVTAPSLSQPLVSQIETSKNIIVDITVPNKDLTSKPDTQLTNLHSNVTLENIYPPGSVFTQINGSPVIDSSQPHQMIILYDINKNVIENKASNYPYVKRINSFFSGTSNPPAATPVTIIPPAATPSKPDNTITYILCILFFS